VVNVPSTKTSTIDGTCFNEITIPRKCFTIIAAQQIHVMIIATADVRRAKSDHRCNNELLCAALSVPSTSGKAQK
jgi:hypothetical protein